MRSSSHPSIGILVGVMLTLIFLVCSIPNIDDLLQRIWGDLLTGGMLRSCIKLVSSPFN